MISVFKKKKKNKIKIRVTQYFDNKRKYTKEKYKREDIRIYYYVTCSQSTKKFIIVLPASKKIKREEGPFRGDVIIIILYIITLCMYVAVCVLIDSGKIN